jgi:hypothetical protein
MDNLNTNGALHAPAKIRLDFEHGLIHIISEGVRHDPQSGRLYKPAQLHQS